MGKTSPTEANLRGRRRKKQKQSLRLAVSGKRMSLNPRDPRRRWPLDPYPIFSFGFLSQTAEEEKAHVDDLWASFLSDVNQPKAKPTSKVLVQKGRSQFHLSFRSFVQISCSNLLFKRVSVNFPFFFLFSPSVLFFCPSSCLFLSFPIFLFHPSYKLFRLDQIGNVSFH